MPPSQLLYYVLVPPGSHEISTCAYGARPVRFTVRVPLLASLKIVSVPVIGFPATVGLKVTRIWQVPPATTGLAHVPRAAVYAVLPVTFAALMWRSAEPVFVTVSVVVVVLPSGCRPKFRVACTPMVGTATAVPLMLATIVPPLLATVTVAVFKPAPEAAVGANRTLMLQKASPALRVRIQLAAGNVTTN